MYFEEFEEGKVLETRSRIITGTDIDLFATLTGALNPVFLSDRVGMQRGYKGRVSPGILTFATSVGLLYELGFFDHLIALLEIKEVRFPAPVYPGDEIRCEVRVAEKRETKKEDRGIVVLRWECFNQDKIKVLEAGITIMVERKPSS